MTNRAFNFPSTNRGPATLLYDTFVTTSSFTAPVISASPPSGGLVPVPMNLIQFTLCGVGADDSTVNALVVGWYREKKSGLYIPYELLSVEGVLGDTVGVAGNDHLDETVRLTKALSAVTDQGLHDTDRVAFVEPAEGEVAVCLLDVLSCQFIQIIPIVGSADSANVIASSY